MGLENEIERVEMRVMPLGISPVTLFWYFLVLYTWIFVFVLVWVLRLLQNFDNTDFLKSSGQFFFLSYANVLLFPNQKIQLKTKVHNMKYLKTH